MVPSRVKKLAVDWNYKQRFLDVGETAYIYEDYDGNVGIVFSKVNLNKYSSTYEMCEEGENFVNGFKRVKFVDGTYSFVSEETGELLPYKFNVATDFNEYGFAMVAIDYGVSWFYKGKVLFDSNGKVELKRWYGDSQKFLTVVEDFEDFLGCPVSMVYETYADRAKDSYKHFIEAHFLNSNGDFITFKAVNDEERVQSSFRDSFNWDENMLDVLGRLKKCSKGFVLFGNYIIFSSGYFCTCDEFCRRPDIMKVISRFNDSLENRKIVFDSDEDGQIGMFSSGSSYVMRPKDQN